jgi:hypothetical protein
VSNLNFNPLEVGFYCIKHCRNFNPLEVAAVMTLEMLQMSKYFGGMAALYCSGHAASYISSSIVSSIRSILIPIWVC